MAADRSPFEYLLNTPSGGGGVAAAFQEGETTASRLATEEASRASQRLNQQLVGLSIEDLRANAPVRAAERERALGQFRQLGGVPALPGELGPTPAMRLPESAQAFRSTLAPVWSGLERQYGLPGGFMDSLARVESSYGTAADRGTAYVGPFQIGVAAATEVGLAAGDRSDPTKASAGAAQYAANVARQLRQTLGRDPAPWEIYLGYQQGAGGARALLANPQRPALEALTAAYNGDERKARAALTQNGGRTNMTAGEFASLWQRKFSADAVAQTPAATEATTGLAPPGAQPRTTPTLPSGVFGEGFLTSPAGVPMTAPNADRPAPGAAESQFMVPMGERGMVPVGPPPAGGAAPVPAPAPAMTANPISGDIAGGGMPMAGNAAFPSTGTTQIPDLLAPFRAMFGQPVFTAPPAAPPVVSTPGQPTLGGATPIVPAGLSPAMGGGTQLPGALSPTPMSGQAQGLLPTPAQQQARTQAAAGAAQPAGLGLEYFGPAQRVLEQATQQRAILQQRMEATRYMPYETAMAERAKILTENQALLAQVRDANVDLAAGSLLAGQTQPTNALLQPYGIIVQPKVTNGRLTGYDMIRGGDTIRSNVPAEQIARAVREGLSSTAAAAAAKQREAQFDVMLDGLKKALEVKATTAGKIAEIEATARARGFSQVQASQDGTSVLAIDPTTGDGFRYVRTPIPGSKGEFKDEIIKIRAGVPIQ